MEVSRILKGSIDVTKIDKSKIVSVNARGESFKNGGKFMNVDVLIFDDVNEWGQIAAITQQVSMEEREAELEKQKAIAQAKKDKEAEAVANIERQKVIEAALPDAEKLRKHIAQIKSFQSPEIKDKNVAIVLECFINDLKSTCARSINLLDELINNN